MHPALLTVVLVAIAAALGWLALRAGIAAGRARALAERRGALLAGFAAALAATQHGSRPWEWALALGVAVLGIALGPRVRGAAALAMGLALVAGLVLART